MATILNERELIERMVLERARALNGLPAVPPPPRPNQAAALAESLVPPLSPEDRISPYESPSASVGQMQREGLRDILRGMVEGMATPDASDFFNPIAALPVKALGAAAKAAPVTKLSKMGKAKEALYDSLEGIKQFDPDLYKAARLHAGTAKQLEEEVKGFGQAISPVAARGLGENVDDAANLLRGGPTRFDRAGQWAAFDRLEEAAKIADAPINGHTADEWLDLRKALEADMGPDEVARAAEARDAATKLFNAQLDEAVEVGLISKKSADSAKEKGLKYVPLHALADDAAEELGFHGVAKNPSADWFRKMQPSKTEVELENPFDQALVERVGEARRNINRNKVMNVLTGLPQKDPAFKSLVVPLETAEYRQARIDLSKNIQETQRKIAELTGAINLKGKTSDALYGRFNKVQDELANLAGELANKNLNWEPRPEIRSTIEKIQRRQAKVLGTVRKMKENSAGMRDLAEVLANAEGEIRTAKTQLWSMRANKLPEGFKEVKRFKNGLQERWAVPEDIADSLAQMSQEQADLVTGIAAKSSKLLRTGATQLNMTFTPANAARDATFAYQRYGVNGVDWAKGLFSALKHDDIYKDFVKNGGGYSTFAEVINARPSMTGGQGFTLRAAKTATSPAQLFEAVSRPLTYLNESIELAPRLGAYRKALGKGLSPDDAAFVGRDITVDFMKAGSVTRLANMWVPFLNANLQGTANIAKMAAGRDGAGAYLRMGATIGLPAVTTYAWNTTNFPQVWEDISSHDKAGNWIIIYGDHKDNQGFYDEVVRIPKDHTSILATPALEAMEHAYKNNPVEYRKMAAKLLGGLSPVGGIDDQGDASLLDVMSRTTPPIAKGLAEVATNTNFFTGRPVVPQSMEHQTPETQYYPGETPESFVQIGKALGISPLKVRQFLRSTTGSLSETASNPTPSGVGGQFARRFGKAYGGQLDRNEIKTLEGMREKTDTAKWNLDRLIDKASRGELNKAEQKVLKTNPVQVKDRVLGIQDRDLSPLERALKHGGFSAEDKGKWARAKLNSLSEAERGAQIKKWRANGVLSGALLEQLEAEAKSVRKRIMWPTLEGLKKETK